MGEVSKNDSLPMGWQRVRSLGGGWGPGRDSGLLFDHDPAARGLASGIAVLTSRTPLA